MTEVNPYREGSCWYGIKIPRKHSTMPCGIDARLYVVNLENMLHAYSEGPHVTVWLCLNHKQAMERDGFSLTLAQ